MNPMRWEDKYNALQVRSTGIQLRLMQEEIDDLRGHIAALASKPVAMAVAPEVRDEDISAAIMSLHEAAHDIGDYRLPVHRKDFAVAAGKILRELFARILPAQAVAGEVVEALTRAERKLAAYVGVCDGDKELTEAVLPMVRAALSRLTNKEGGNG